MNKKRFSKFISFGLTLTLLCGMLPMQNLNAEYLSDFRQSGSVQPITGQTKKSGEPTENKDIQNGTVQIESETDSVKTEEIKLQEIEQEIEIEDISINTVEDFLTFAENCYIDSWSVNKRVTLKADINLEGVDFSMIPVFAGVFDGMNHTISGFNYVGDGYVVGLFRYIEKNGVVENVKLKGNITGENEKECIGSLCGVNYGMIKNCSFQGTVSGRDTVGGIVGVNESSGTVTGCTAAGRVTGYYETGGIVGKNHGVLAFCTNRAGVNDDSEWVEEDDEMGVGIFFSINVSESDTDLYSGVDTGGVAGYSDGMLSRCTNYGTIGYMHTGYNIGGIAGRQAGVVSLCVNNGTVYGRKDVGGIVGQMEPYIEVDEAESLRNAVNKLHDLIEKTIDDLQAGKDAIKGDFDALTGYGDAALESGDALAGQMTDFIDDNLDQTQAIAERMEHIMDQLPDILDDVSNAGDAFSDLNSVLKQLAEDLNIVGKLDNSPYNETDYSRVTLLSTVGGSLVCDKVSPEVNETVTITVAPDDGYILKGELKAADANGKTVNLTAAGGDQYTFIMPTANVKVTAEFTHVGTFLVKSTAGGRVETTEGENGETVFEAKSASGYSFVRFEVDGKPMADGQERISLKKSDYISNNKDVIVEAFFEEKAGVHKITFASGTGGTVWAESTTAAKDETVVLHVTTLPNYKLKKIEGISSYTASPENAGEYTFIMPDRDVIVEASFEYTGSADVYAESTIGGSVSVVPSTEGGVYNVIIRSSADYELGQGTCLVIESSVQPKLSSILESSGGSKTIKISRNSSKNFIVSQAPSVMKASAVFSVGFNALAEEDLAEDESNRGHSENEEADEHSSGQSGLEGEDIPETESIPESELMSEGQDTSEDENSQEQSDSTPQSTKAQEEEEEAERSSQEENVNAGTETKVTLTKEQLTDNGDGTYKYVLRLSEFTDARPIRVMGTFQKKPVLDSDGYSVTAASGTGGTVAVDASRAAAGDIVYVTPASSTGYMLGNLTIKTSVGAEVSYTKDSDGKRYYFTMPAADVKVLVSFEPIQIVLSSNVSGNASYSGTADGIVTLSVKPDTSYTLKGNPVVTDANGRKLPLSKKQSGSYVYEFDISGAATPCTIEITFQKQNKSDAVDTAKTDIEEAIENLQEASENVSASIRKIKDLITNTDGSIKTWDQLTSDQQNQLISELLNLAESVGDMSEAASSILSNLSVMAKILMPYITEAAEAAKKDIDKATDHVQRVIDSLKAANSGIKGIVNYINAQPDIQFSKLGDEFDVTREDLHNQLQGISDSLKSLSDNASNYSDIINGDLRAVNDQLNIVFNLLADHLVDYSELSVEELYEEVSDEDIDTVTTGRADTCTNRGIVEGDINVGGIAGAMSIDEEDPESSAAGSIEYQIGRRFITKCIINGSVNEGYVTAKKNGAGGIVGYMKHGIVMESEGYGSVESIEGDYAGGICGESLTIIKRCYALCSVSGGRNVGGIAGYADTLQDCYAIVDCEADTGRKGAIAGQIASYENMIGDEEEEAKVCRNYYVGDDLYGIDNISYIGIAEPITYDELLTVEKLPTEFWHLKVIYRIEDSYLGQQEIKFGESLAKLEYPEIPEKEGYYGVWPDYSDRVMVGSLVVEGEYKENVTVVQSNEKLLESAEGEHEKPYALVEQIFTEDTELNVKVSDRTPPAEAFNKEYIIYDISLENGGIRDTDTFAIRIYNPYEDAVVWGYFNGNWTQLESKVRGQYLQVDMTGTEESFCIIAYSSKKLQNIITAVFAAAALLLLVSLIKKANTRRLQKKEKKSGEDEEK